MRLLRPLDVYVGAIAACGAAIFCLSVSELSGTAHPVEFTIFTLLALIAGRFPLKVPGINAFFSVSDTFFVASAVLFGPAPGTVTIAIDSLMMSYGRGQQAQRLLFNGSAPALAFWCGSAVFFWLSGLHPVFGAAVPADALVLPLAAFAAVYFVLNSGLTALAVAMQKQQSPYAVWRSHFMMLALNYFAAASAAFLLVLLTEYLSVIALAAVLPLLAVINLAMRSWTGRLEDAE
ncbi:MAG TPA: hypothetical protein VFZ31_10340, partial [Vicinamibacterales bacterium]